MESEFEENEYANDEAMDALLDLLRSLPKNAVKMIDFGRYRSIMQTAAEMEEILAQSGEEVRLNVNIDDLFNMGSIEVQLSDLTVRNPAQFAKMISKADTFEIYPKTDGSIQFNVSFRSVLKTLP